MILIGGWLAAARWRLNQNNITIPTMQYFSTSNNKNNSDSDNLTHVDSEGHARMVGVGNKSATRRVALASGKIILGEAAFKLVQENNIKKGDVLSVAQIAGIMGAKQTSSLIPLCHPLNLDNVEVKLSMEDTDLSIKVEAMVEVTGKTGVEMEALTSVSVTMLTVYDMCKAVTKDMVITDIKLRLKTGGKSDYTQPEWLPGHRDQV